MLNTDWTNQDQQLVSMEEKMKHSAVVHQSAIERLKESRSNSDYTMHELYSYVMKELTQTDYIENRVQKLWDILKNVMDSAIHFYCGAVRGELVISLDSTDLLMPCHTPLHYIIFTIQKKLDELHKEITNNSISMDIKLIEKHSIACIEVDSTEIGRFIFWKGQWRFEMAGRINQDNLQKPCGCTNLMFQNFVEFIETGNQDKFYLLESDKKYVRDIIHQCKNDIFASLMISDKALKWCDEPSIFSKFEDNKNKEG